MSLNRTVAHVRLTREDLSDYLIHFTKGEDAINTLATILYDNQLKDVNNTGVICFTEAPFPILVNMFADVFGPYTNPMYAPYGVAIKKTKLFELGGRPVIYGTASERLLIDPQLLWRFELYDPVHRDFAWLREWRVPIGHLNLEAEDCFIITNKEHELTMSFDHEDILEIEPDVDISDGIPVTHMIGRVARQFKGISLEKLREISNPTNANMADILLAQSFTDMQYVNLGLWNPET